MFGETIFYIKIWNHPIETTIYKWLFGVPGGSMLLLSPKMPSSLKILTIVGGFTRSEKNDDHQIGNFPQLFGVKTKNL